MATDPLAPVEAPEGAGTAVMALLLSLDFIFIL
jgi:hypothetical protein